jgi:hypothetical protein
MDPQEDWDLENILYELENQRDFCSNVLSVKSVDIGPWDDDHPLNKRDESLDFIQNAVWEPEEI